MDAPGCGGMNRLGGGKSPLVSLSLHCIPKRAQRSCKAAMLTGMSGGGAFGGMDNLGNMGSFGGRMTGESFDLEISERCARSPTSNQTECTDLPLNVALKLRTFNKY